MFSQTCNIISSVVFKRLTKVHFIKYFIPDNMNILLSALRFIKTFVFCIYAKQRSTSSSHEFYCAKGAHKT